MVKPTYLIKANIKKYIITQNTGGARDLLKKHRGELSARFLCNMGDLSSNHELSNIANLCYDIASKKTTNNHIKSRIYNYRGDQSRIGGDYKNSIKMYTKAIITSPNDPTFYFNRAKTIFLDILPIKIDKTLENAMVDDYLFAIKSPILREEIISILETIPKK
ncbi:MAG: hypothetical protein CVU81_02950 [Euryarchaeota archaeon HGW-Euryarchaeota-1]|nr:MAG: hypothetical protein CVU81_02950 [Euryarchaeota archaeon HGW-Euryarchaeota-1]